MFFNFHCDIFRRRSEYMSVRRIAYTLVIYNLVPRVCVLNTPLSPSSPTLVCLLPRPLPPKNKHVLFGTKMIALLLGCNGVLHVLQNKWNCCDNRVGF